MSTAASSKKRPVSLKPRSEYVETESGNRISRKSQLHSTAYIVLGGRTIIEHGVVLRGDLHRKESKSPVIALGKYCILNPGCSITPPDRLNSQDELTYYPVKIGSYVQIGENSSVQAASIGSCVFIGKNVKIGQFVIIKDCVKIADNSVIPPFAVIAPFSFVSGEPALVRRQLPESAQEVLELSARRVYCGIDCPEPFDFIH